MAHRINDFQPSPNLTAKDKEDIANAAAASVKNEIEAVTAAGAEDRKKFFETLNAIKADIAKIVADEVTKQLRTPAAIAAAEQARANSDRSEAARGQAERDAAKADAEKKALAM